MSLEKKWGGRRNEEAHKSKVGAESEERRR